jgi:preprotein translocase subunit YajC
MPSDLLLNIGLFALLGVVIIFMFRNSRKRRRDAEELQTKMVVGAEVMTQHGIYGKLLSIDEDTNEALIESTPGTVLRVHRQIIAKVVDPTIPEAAEKDEELETLEDSGAISPVAGDLDEPEFGERIDKPARDKPTE